MRGTLTLLAFTGLATTGPATGAPVAASADETPAADVRLVYGHPVIAAGNSGITWHWTLTNNGPAVADTIVATHRVSAGQKVTAVSDPCTGEAADVVCRFAVLRPGERRTGWIKTSVPAGAKGLRVSAQMTWGEERARTTPGLGMTPGQSGA